MKNMIIIQLVIQLGIQLSTVSTWFPKCRTCTSLLNNEPRSSPTLGTSFDIGLSLLSISCYEFDRNTRSPLRGRFHSSLDLISKASDPTPGHGIRATALRSQVW